MMVSSQLHFLAKLLASLTVVTVIVNVIILLSPPLLPSIHPNQDENSIFFHQRQQLFDPLFHRSGVNVLSAATTTKIRRKGNTTSIGGSIPSSQSPFTTQTWSEEEGLQYMMDIFQRAGISLTSDMASQLPTWSQVRQVVGDYPHVLNLSTCSTFRNAVPPLERMLGSSGMFNTGTNLVTHLLKQNCEIPERRQYYGPHQSKESYGMRWQVPVSVLSLCEKYS
jgi:hypothetical protein